MNKDGLLSVFCVIVFELFEHGCIFALGSAPKSNTLAVVVEVASRIRQFGTCYMYS